MNGKTLLAEAIEMKDEIVENRRTIHRTPEVGAHLPQTVQFVEEKLRLLGYEPRELGGGVVAELTGEDMGRCILLRADMDALKVKEKTDLPFRSENGSMHACGHDMHAAMLLGAARLLKAHQSELKGTVKLVFQPDEEGFTGAKAMLKAGVLEAPEPQAAMALHVNSGTPSGLVLCGKGTFMAGCTLFRITVKGVGCHGAMPETGVDPINIAAHIYLALQEITARELPAKTPAIVTMGKFSAGHAPNIIPQEAVIEGTIRTFDRDVTALILRRIGEIALVPASSPINRRGILFYNTLFDENAACHIAFGKGYPGTVKGGTAMTKQELLAHGVNDSIIHEDVMVGAPDMTITGTTRTGENVKIFENGEWAF